MKKTLVTLVALALLTALVGCGVGAALNYSPKTNHVQMPDDKYRVFEKISENKIMLTSNLGKATGAATAKFIALVLQT